MTPHEHPSETTAKREKAEERATAALLALELMHEIRNPLDALNNLIFLSLEKVGEPEMVRKLLASGPGADGHFEPDLCKRVGFREIFDPA